MMSDANHELEAVSVSTVTVTLPSMEPSIPPIPGSITNRNSERYCWVCFATEEDDRTVQWVQPCRCRGTTKWVHQPCLQRWIDEKQRGNSTVKVSCPQCGTEYLIIFPKIGPLVFILDSIDNMISKVCPFVAAGIVVGAVYWTAVTYGAVTVMQVFGQKEGLSVMDQADPLFLLVGLPVIPVMLILGKMVKWEEYVLGFIHRHTLKIPGLRHILPLPEHPSPQSVQQQPQVLNHPISATRVLCGALLLPSIATLFGRFLFEEIPSNLHRTLLGGAAFITVKGAFKIYHSHHQYVRQCKRKILDFDERLATALQQTSSQQESNN